MHATDETTLLLDLLREAGDEPVTLDELEIVGVTDPTAALYALEVAGHAVSRAYEASEAGRFLTCVSLGAPRPSVAPPEPVPAERVRAAAGRGAATRPLLVVALLAALLAALAAAR